MTDEQPKFGDAMDELESILMDIERNDVDLDDLSSSVARAADLIGLCKSKIERAELEVKRVFDAMNDGEEP